MQQSAIEIDAREHPSLFANLENEVLEGDRARHLRAAFAKLNENQRMVIELAYFEGLSQTEMADRLKQPLGTVKTWVRAALKSLRSELGEALTA
jgi:RNA polymerase sigma-70 factor (ECF subfamily)